MAPDLQGSCAFLSGTRTVPAQNEVQANDTVPLTLLVEKQELLWPHHKRKFQTITKKPFVSDLLSYLGREAAVEICGSEPPVQLRLGWDPYYLSRQAEKGKSKEVAPCIKVDMVKGTKGQGWRL